MLLFIQGILTECLLYTRRPARSWELPAGTGQSSSPGELKRGQGPQRKRLTVTIGNNPTLLVVVPKQRAASRTHLRDESQEANKELDSDKNSSGGKNGGNVFRLSN